MQALAPLFLFIAFIWITSAEIPANKNVLMAAVGDVSGLPSGPSSAGTGGLKPIEPDIASKQCIKPPTTQYVYRSDKPWNKAFSENGKTYFNLYGKPCEGPLVRGSCSREHYCDATLPGSSCFIGDKWVSCRKPEQNVQVASLNTGTASDGSPSTAIAKADTQAPPQATGLKSPASATAGANIDNAFTNPTNANPAPVIQSSQTSATQGLNDLTNTVAPTGNQPVSSGPTSITQQLERPAFASNPALTQQQTVSPITAGPSAAVQPSVNPAASLPTTRFGSITPVSSFRDTSVTNPVAVQRPSFMQNIRSQFSSGSNSGGGNIAKLFAVDTLLNGLASFLRVDNSANTSRPTIVQNVINVIVPAQTNVVAATTQPNIARPQQTAPPVSITNRDLPVLRVAQTYRVSDSTSINIGTAVDVIVLQKNSQSLDTALERFLSSYNSETPLEHIAPATDTVQIEPAIRIKTLSAESSSTSQRIYKMLDQHVVAFATTTRGDFTPASSTPRSVSVIQASHIISLPELLDVISQRSTVLLDRFLAKDAPESSIVATYFDEPSVAYVPSEAIAQLPNDTGDVSRNPTAAVSGSGNATAGTQFTATLRLGSAWVAKSTVQNEQAKQPEPEQDTKKVFGEIIPKMQKEGAVSVRVIRPSIPEVIGEVVRAAQNMLSKAFRWLQP